MLVVATEVLAADLKLVVAVNQAEVVAENLVLAVPEARQTVAAVHWKGDQRVGVVGKDLDCAAQAVSQDVARKILAVLNALPGRPSFDDFWPLVRLS